MYKKRKSVAKKSSNPEEYQPSGRLRQEYSKSSIINSSKDLKYGSRHFLIKYNTNRFSMSNIQHPIIHSQINTLALPLLPKTNSSATTPSLKSHLIKTSIPSSFINLAPNSSTKSSDTIKNIGSDNEVDQLISTLLPEITLKTIPKADHSNTTPLQETPLEQSLAPNFVADTPLSIVEESTKQNETIEKFKEVVKARVKGYATMTMIGKMAYNPNKKNQDSRLIIKDFNDVKDAYLFAVLDGHGHNGHLVSNYAKKRLPINIEHEILKSIIKNEDNKEDRGPLDIDNEILIESFKKTNEDILLSNIDVTYSGTTLVLVLLVGNSLICANVGDSRAVLGKLNNSQWEAHPISHDHKPDSPREYERIINSNGRVESYVSASGGPLGPKRVWKKNENVPGLAMSRALGDKLASEAGVICIPEIIKENLNREDKVLVLASDGIWEHINNLEAIKIVGEYWEQNNPKAAVEKLVREARSKWKNELVIDDITAIVTFFK